MASPDSAQRKRELLRRRLAAQRLTHEPALGGARRPARIPGVGYPVTAGQRRMWFLQQLRPGSSAYTVSAAFELTGPLDVGALRGALLAVARRHEILRTTYRVTADGGLEQVVRDDVTPAWLSVDVSAEPDGDHESRARQVAQRAARRPFDLTAESPLRVTVLRHGPDRHTLALAAHHIAWDDACWDVFFGDLLTAYDRRGTGTGTGDQPGVRAGGQFLDAAAPDAARPTMGDLAYWRRRLTPPAEPVRLPVAADDTPGGGGEPDAGRQAVHRASPDLAGEVRAFAARHGATPFMVLLAAYGALLHRVTGATVGSPVVNRDRAETDGVLGYFGNTVCLRLAVGPADTFTDLLERTREVCRGAFAHADVDLADVVRNLNPDRADGVSSLFTTMFAVRAPAAAALHGRDLRGERRPAHNGTAQFPLTVVAELGGDGGGLDTLELETTYQVGAVSPPFAQAVGPRLERLLAAALARPDAPIGAADLLTGAERERVLTAWNDTAWNDTAWNDTAWNDTAWNDTAGPSPAGPWTALFAARAEAAPQRTALVTTAGTVTYGELAARADAFARVLAGRGVGPGTVVGVALPRSADLVVALAGTGRAGAAYLPIDPDHPADRISFMIEDASPAVVVTTRALAARLPFAPGTGLLLIDELELGSGSEPVAVATEAWPPAVDPDSPVYLIYTSGSTGRPKGVVVGHRALTNFLASIVEAVGITPADRLLAATTLAFDPSTVELLAPLTVGASIHLAEGDQGRDPAALAGLLGGGAVTLAQATPSRWRSILDASPGPYPAVRALSGGEPLPPDLARELLTRADSLTNLYGPTETTVWVTTSRVRAAETAGDRLTIGRPLRNTRAYVLDGALMPVPAGVGGELYLAGDCVAHGYLHRPALTASRYVASPFAAGERMYRTGDLARWTATGELVVAGRSDDQVKVRGVRIEPGEIEAVLEGRPGVGRCAVVVRADGPAGPALVAYIVPAAGAATKPADPADLADLAGSRALVGELRAHAASVLPRALVPAAFVTLPALPTTPAGKLDRRALPAPDFAAATRPGRAPATRAETVLRDVFAEVLGQPGVGVDDSFFHLGGDSILAFAVVTRAAAAGVTVALADVFASPTVAGLAAAAQVAATAQPAVELPVDPEDLARWRARLPALHEVWPLSPAQAGLLFHRLLDGDDTPDIYVIQFVLDLAGEKLEPERLRAASRALIAWHAVLRAAVLSDGREPAQVILPVVEPPWTIVGLSAWPAAEAAAETSRLVEADRAVRFDLAAPPLIRFLWIRTGANSARLAVCAHHIVVDGWSLPLVLRELFTLAAGADADVAASRLPAVRPYADHLRWLRTRDSDAARAAWRAELAGVEGPTLLAGGGHRISSAAGAAGAAGTVGAGRPAGAAAVDREVGPALTARLAAFGRERGVTLSTALRAAHAVLLARAVGRDDVVFGTVTSGRSPELPGVDSMIGMFVTTVPVRVTVRADGTFVELAAAVQAAQGALFAHHHLGLAEIQALAGGGDLFDTLLVVESYPFDTSALIPPGGPRLVGIDGHDATNYALTIRVIPGERLRLTFGYQRDVLDDATVAGLADRLLALLAQIAADPDRPVGALDAVPVAERERADLQPAPQAAYAVDAVSAGDSVGVPGTLPELFEAQVRRAPSAVALRWRDVELTYAELDARANQLARLLARRGVGPESLVAVALPRSADLVVALLAVQKAGGACLPVDPTYPAERIAFMLRDAAPVRAVTTVAGRATLPAGVGVPLIALDDPLVVAALADQPPTAPDPDGRARPDNLAYVIYASGSTGRPKGTGVPHRNVVRLFDDTRSWFRFDATDVWTLFHSASFDFSVWELWGPLLHGGRLVVVDHEVSRSPEQFRELLARESVTVLNQTPSAFGARPGRRPVRPRPPVGDLRR